MFRIILLLELFNLIWSPWFWGIWTSFFLWMSATLSNNLGLITLICSTWSSTLSTHLVSSAQSYQLNLTNNLFIIILIWSSYFDPLDMRNMIWSAWSYQLICYYKTLPNLFHQLDLINFISPTWLNQLYFTNLIKSTWFETAIPTHYHNASV